MFYCSGRDACPTGPGGAGGGGRVFFDEAASQRQGGDGEHCNADGMTLEG